MHPQPTTPLGQALAAIIAILIAALAEHAAEHPVLAPGLRATIRQLEKIAARFDALVARHAARTLRARPRAPLLRPRHESQQASWERKTLLFVNNKKQKNVIHWRCAIRGRHRANG